MRVNSTPLPPLARSADVVSPKAITREVSTCGAVACRYCVSHACFAGRRDGAVGAERDLRLIDADPARRRGGGEGAGGRRRGRERPRRRRLHRPALGRPERRSGPGGPAHPQGRQGGRRHATSASRPFGSRRAMPESAMVQRLLDAHADPNIAPPTGGSPLMVGGATGRRGGGQGAARPRRGPQREGGLPWPDSLDVGGRRASIRTSYALLLAAHADVHARTKTWKQRVMLCCQYYERRRRRRRRG